MSEFSQIKHKQHAWEQWDWLWHALAYGLLILNAAIARENDTRNGSIQTILVLTVVLAFWRLPLAVIQREYWSEHVQRTLIYFLIGWILWGIMIHLHPAALMLAGMFYPILFSRVPIRFSIPSASILTLGLFLAAVIWFKPSADFLPTLVTVTVLLLVTAIAIGLFINSLIRQSHNRQQLIDELTQTRANLLKAEREAGIMMERQRMAREIHDTLAQDFTSIIMHLTAAQLSGQLNIQSHIQLAEQTAREGLNEARRIVWALRPEQLENSTLAESIENLAARFSAENSIRVNTIITGTPAPLGQEKEAALLRATQEALHNVKKHAHSKNVDITLSYMSDLIALDIVDDGIGFEKNNQHGFGLNSMRERIKIFNGTLTIETSKNKGTAIAISLPLDDQP